MITDMWIGPSEVKQLLVLLEGLNAMYEEFQETANDVSVDLFSDEQGWGSPRAVRDCNGDIFGWIGFGENGGIVFFGDDGVKDNVEK